MSSAVKVSLVLPVYNTSKYLHQCLDSCAGQTYQNLEIICVNDGSTDNSLQILKEYQTRDSRFVVFDKSNEGMGATRNFALQYITGEYVLFVDSDDWLEKNTVELLVAASEKNRADVVCMNWFLNEKPKQMALQKTQLDFPGDNERRWLLENASPPSWGKLLRIDFLRKNAVEFANFRCGEDAIVHWKCCMFGEHYAIVNTPLYHYRIGRVSSGDKRYSSRGLDIFDSQKETRQFIVDHNFYDLYKTTFLMICTYDCKYYYDRISPELRIVFREKIAKNFNEVEWRMIENFEIGMSSSAYCFFMNIHGTLSFKKLLKAYYYWFRWKLGR